MISTPKKRRQQKLVKISRWYEEWDIAESTLRSCFTPIELCCDVMKCVRSVKFFSFWILIRESEVLCAAGWMKDRTWSHKWFRTLCRLLPWRNFIHTPILCAIVCGSFLSYKYEPTPLYFPHISCVREPWAEKRDKFLIINLYGRPFLASTAIMMCSTDEAAAEI